MQRRPHSASVLADEGGHFEWGDDELAARVMCDGCWTANILPEDWKVDWS